MNQQTLERLPKTYTTQGGFVHTQQIRGLNSVVFKKEHPIQGTTSYEVFQIKAQKGQEVFGKSYPPKERVPGNEDFGGWAWAYRNYLVAMKKHSELESQKQKS